MGEQKASLYSHHDLLTINEIFSRQDYLANENDKVVVDLGSNIGLSALYFLTRSSDFHCYLFEPDPRNLERLKLNLKDYALRYELKDFAGAAKAGRVRFGQESTGRFSRFIFSITIWNCLSVV